MYSLLLHWLIIEKFRLVKNQSYFNKFVWYTSNFDFKLLFNLVLLEDIAHFVTYNSKICDHLFLIVQ